MKLNERLSNLESAVSRIEITVNRIESRLDSNEKAVEQLTTLTAKVIEMQKDMKEHMNTRFDRIERELEHIHTLRDLDTIRQIVDRRFKHEDAERS